MSLKSKKDTHAINARKQKKITTGSRAPGKHEGHEGDIIVRNIYGKGAHLFVKYNNVWYSLPLEKKETSSKDRGRVIIRQKTAQPSLNSTELTYDKTENMVVVDDAEIQAQTIRATNCTANKIGIFATGGQLRSSTVASSELSDIATNKTGVATNVGNISTNTGNISTNTGNISTNASGISTNASGISTNTSGISTNASGISTNTSNISTNTSNVSTNTSNISTNTSNISTNTSAIGLNTTHRSSTGSDHSLLSATAGTSTASKALIMSGGNAVTSFKSGNLTISGDAITQTSASSPLVITKGGNNRSFIKMDGGSGFAQTIEVRSTDDITTGLADDDGDATNTDVNFAAGNKAWLELTGNINQLNFIFPSISGNFQIILMQDGTGSRTVASWRAWEPGTPSLSDNDGGTAGGIRWAAKAVAPTLSTALNTADIISFYWDATNEVTYGVTTLNF